jgi:hypothetical protein
MNTKTPVEQAIRQTPLALRRSVSSWQTAEAAAAAG